MAYDEHLANRIREQLAGQEAVTEKRMFGGLAFLVHGNLAVAASRTGGLMVRVDPQDSDGLVDADGVERMVMRGREMDGWLLVEAGRVTGDDVLASWVRRGVAAAQAA
ncbi:MAG TPA: TfoX/Sxy family protein [Thermoleophilaceae bacterium]|nr:TfoX/Sxy family protein [Thermoleophilaceae bacterium]